MFQSMHMRQQPRLHLLVASDLRPGVRTGAERGDEQRRLPYLAGVTVADRQGRAGPVHEGFLAGLVLLAQHHVEFLAPTLIELAESAVAVTVRAGVAIFLPEQLQGHVTMTLQLFMNGGEVWRGLLSGWLWG
jgi:hypothetical protein